MSNKPSPIHRIRVFPGGNAHERRYCLTTPLSTRTANVVLNGFLTEAYFKEQQQSYALHKEVFGFANYVFKELDRVTEMRISRFQISVTKAAVFDWEEVDRWILSAIRSSFFADDAFEKVDVQDLTKEAEPTRAPANSKAR